MFSNPNIQSTFNEFNGTSFDYLFGFGVYSSNNTTYYYVMEPGYDKVFILDDEWKFISFKVFNYPFDMISIDNSVYMTGIFDVWKLDQDLNILINYNIITNSPYEDGNPIYGGISYNPSNGLIYVAEWYLNEIHVFNLDLTLIRRFSTSPHQPSSITISSNQLYVGTDNGIVLVYQNESLINQLNGCNGNIDYVTSILFDPNGFMATTCSYPTNKLYLFSPDGSFTNKTITTPSDPSYIGFDSKGRFIIISGYQISIYN